MSKKKPDARRRLLPIAMSLCAFGWAVPALGQAATDQEPAPARKSDQKKSTVSQSKPTSPNATINLVNMLVKQGVLKEEQAQALIKQADDEAYVSRQAARDATVKAEEAAKAATAASAAAEPAGTRHVTYVPEVVKRQLREEIKQEVMNKAQKENWASPGAYPEWAQRIRFSGDMRLRYQGSFFPSGNDQADAFNFNAINTGSPIDESLKNFPTYNTSKNRNQFRFRARLGADVDLFNGFSAGLRIASGENSSPVSTNQTFGASTSGGDFSKYALWLDRAFLKYQGWGDNLVLSAGRFDNPFWSPTDLVWYKDIGFDGFAVQGKYQLTEAITPFVVAGAFPIYNSDFNAGTNFVDSTGAPVKLGQDKWLFGGQVGLSARLENQSSVRFAVAYYDFINVQARASDCFATSSSDLCNTDQLRPAFAQKGNTYTQLRNNLLFPISNTDFQYYGLASQFRPVVASGQFDLGEFHPLHVVLDGEYVWNSAFKRSDVAAVAANNFGSSPDNTVGPYKGGNQGWLARVTVGNTEIKHLGDWSVHAGYKYLESDATIDAFVDSDFGLGGTNLKGYFIGGNLGLSENVWASVRWLSANNIASVPYAVDVVQVDLNARF
jgi:hypothetical protein